MSLKIVKIDIRNFRSARSLTLAPENLAILVGKNDSGKSNVIRALNLFFNGNTDPSEVFDFETDHNVFNQPNRRAKEISIKLEISLPNSYQDTNGDYVVWEKRWRDQGLVHNKYIGIRRVAGPRGGTNLIEVEIPDRSNLHALLRNIVFVYIPAIKDLEYFSELRASIYDVIAEVADRGFRDSSREFERSIFIQLEDLITRITNSLGFRSRLALPKDLSHIFESLDFLSEGQDISLDARGDGIKARHIPLILKFMADKKRRLQVQGGPPHSFIWGYEEPENSLELSSSVELADQFWEMIDDGISQIFLTTHSPVFYNLYRKQRNNNAEISCHHMFRESEEDGTKEAQDFSSLDERMGTTALFAPMVEDLEDRVRRQEQARITIEQLAEANRRKLFVEGPSDRTFFSKAFDVFAHEKSPDIDIETQEAAGVNYVTDMMLSWRSRAKHHPDQPRAAGLVDEDSDGNRTCKEWNQVPDNVKSVKCFKIPKPPHIIPVLAAGFKIPVVLETLYDLPSWEWAGERGHLTERNMLGVVPNDLSNRIINGQTVLDDHLQEDWSIYVKKEMIQAGKAPMARYFARMDEETFRERFQFLGPLIKEIVDYLFPEQ